MYDKIVKRAAPKLAKRTEKKTTLLEFSLFFKLFLDKIRGFSVIPKLQVNFNMRLCTEPFSVHSKRNKQLTSTLPPRLFF